MSLLRDLLKVISVENLATSAILARSLNVSQGLVELMLADLERAGYLRAVTGACSRCVGCGPRQTCQSPQPRLWIRTNK